MGKYILDIAFCGSPSSIGGLMLDEVINLIGMRHGTEVLLLKIHG